MNEKDVNNSLNDIDDLNSEAALEYYDKMYRKGRLDEALEVVLRLLQKVPEWSDEKIARIVSDNRYK